MQKGELSEGAMQWNRETASDLKLSGVNEAASINIKH
jgi:hypothetical protein